MTLQMTSRRKTVQLSACSVWLGGKLRVTDPPSIKTREMNPYQAVKSSHSLTHSPLAQAIFG